MAELAKKEDKVDYHIQDQKHSINTELIGIIKLDKTRSG